MLLGLIRGRNGGVWVGRLRAPFFHTGTGEDPEKKHLLILIFNMSPENTVITPRSSEGACFIHHSLPFHYAQCKSDPYELASQRKLQNKTFMACFLCLVLQRTASSWCSQRARGQGRGGGGVYLHHPGPPSPPPPQAL